MRVIIVSMLALAACVHGKPCDPPDDDDNSGGNS